MQLSIVNQFFSATENNWSMHYVAKMSPINYIRPFLAAA